MKIYYQKAPEEKGDVIYSVETRKICANPNQPRKVFADDAIIKLADSIRQYGMIQPITVRKIGEEYELISGERRLRAAKELGMDYVPCIIMDINEEKSAEISIIENLIREDLNIFEQAQAIETLIDTYNLTQEEIARRLSNSQSFIANKLRLLRLSASEKEKILKNNLTERHARALLRIYDTELREKILNQIIEEGLNVGKTEESIYHRFQEHIQDSRKERCKNRPLYRAMNKYGAENFKIELIEETSHPEVREEFWISHYDSYHNGYNATRGGDGKKYIDYELVCNTYQKLRNASQTAKELNVSIDTVLTVAKQRNVLVPQNIVNREQQSKAIVMIVNGVIQAEFYAIIDAAHFLLNHDIARGDARGAAVHIRDCANGKRKSAYGKQWQWKQL